MEGCESLKFILNERNESLSKLNENNKQLIHDIEIKYNEENSKIKSHLFELERDVEIKNKVISTIKKKLENFMEKDENHNIDIIHLRTEYEESFKRLENDKLKIHQDLILSENKYKKMIKELEILVYKVNLENFNLKDKLENKLQSKKDENKILLEEKTCNLKDKLNLLQPSKDDSVIDSKNVTKSLKIGINNNENSNKDNNINTSKNKNIIYKVYDKNKNENKIIINNFSNNLNEYSTFNLEKSLDVDKEIENIENNHLKVIFII